VDYQAQGKQVAVLDAPLLLEAGWDARCDIVLMVECPLEVRRQRALARGWTAAQFDDRERAQLPVAEKRQQADVEISNGGSEADLRDRVQDFWTRHVAPKLAEA
jgi:dephospho-CoA kinase